MTIKELTQGISDCECGKLHSCPIDCVVIGKDALSSLPKMCEGYKSILLISDTNTQKVCGNKVSVILGDKLQTNLVLSPQGEDVIPTKKKLQK